MGEAMAEQQRTEDQILHSEPVQVILGGRKYPVRPLSIRKSREWRQLLSATIQEVLGKHSGPASADALGAVFMRVPEKMGELLWAYAPELPRAEIEEEATDAELVAALREVMRLAFPFVGELQTLLALTGRG